MKMMLFALGLVAFLTGCASQYNGMGGTSDEYASQPFDYSSSAHFHNQAVNGTGTVTATNRLSDGTF
jgi:hypothetical protein